LFVLQMATLTLELTSELSALYSALPRAHLDAVIAAQMSGACDGVELALESLEAAEAEIDAITRRIEAILNG
jgi:hypothetical protein